MDFISPNYLLDDSSYRQSCKLALDKEGVLVLPKFLTEEAVEIVRSDGVTKLEDAYFCATNHNVYLTPTAPSYPSDHPRNLEVVSSKGLIGDDQITLSSPLKQVYNDPSFQNFIQYVVGEKSIYPYADPLSCVNLHFAKEGQELGWHFDNSSFAVTLLIDKPEAGGVFEYVKDLRDSDAKDMNYSGVGDLLDGKLTPDTLEMEPGTLVLFRGRNSIHRVTPTKGNKTRMLAVLAYNSEPGVSLSENARQIFYGRLS